MLRKLSKIEIPHSQTGEFGMTGYIEGQRGEEDANRILFSPPENIQIVIPKGARRNEESL